MSVYVESLVGHKDLLSLKDVFGALMWTFMMRTFTCSVVMFFEFISPKSGLDRKRHGSCISGVKFLDPTMARIIAQASAVKPPPLPDMSRRMRAPNL